MVSSDPFAPARLGPISLRNRIIKAATFEGRTPRRVVTPELIEFHRRFAAGGVGMTTVAYCAVTRAGSTDGHQIVLDNPEVGAGLRALTDAVHAEGAAIAAQIGHAGPVANPVGTKSPALAPSRVFSPLGMRRTTPRPRPRSPRSSTNTRTAPGCCGTRASTPSRCTSGTAIC